MSRHSIALVVVASLAAGAGAAALAGVVFAGAEESQITAAFLSAFSAAWAFLAILSIRWTDQPQRWAFVPAVLSALVAVALVVRPGIVDSDAAGW